MIQKLTCDQFSANKNLVNSTIQLLEESYLNPETVLKTALANADTVYFDEENNLINAIALSKLIHFNITRTCISYISV